MKNSILLLLLILLFGNPLNAQQTTTLDFVKFVDGKTAEAMFFYEQNWTVFRTQAKASEWIKDFQLLEVEHPEYDIILITTYADSIQYRLIEDRFAEWRKENPLKLLTDELPNDIRINVEGLKTTAKISSPDVRWDPSRACSSESHRAFDFWIGNWMVTRTDGVFAGLNHILPMQGGCVLQENWTSANGSYHGTSYNFFNTSSRTWNQSWIDNQGGVLQISGGMQQGSMVLESEPVEQTDGSIHIDRITWTPNPDGTVTQHWQKSIDNGVTWTDAFFGIYTRIEE